MSAVPANEDVEEIDADELKRRKAAHRAATIAAKKAKKALAKKTKEQKLMRSHFKRESHYDDVTYERASAEWESMLAKISHKGLRTELDYLWNQVVHSLDRKDNLIRRLTADKQAAQDQYQRSASQHRQMFEFMKATFDVLLRSMRAIYDSECNSIVAQHIGECSYAEHISGRNKTVLESLLLASNTLTDHILDVDASRFLFGKEDVNNSHIEKREDMRDQVVHNMSQLHAKMAEAVLKCRRTSMTKRRLKVYGQLVAREESDERIFAQVGRDINRMRQIIEPLLAKRLQLQLGVMAQLATMKQEKDYFIECFLSVRERYEQDMRCDERNTRRVVNAANIVLAELHEIERKGGLLLALCAACRKLETEREKVTPMTVNEAGDDIPKTTYEMDLRHLQDMDYFWLRVGSVQTNIAGLDEEKRKLTEENQRLQTLIRRYCSQSQYARTIRTLCITTVPTVSIPYQEASLMADTNQIKRNETSK